MSSETPIKSRKPLTQIQKLQRLVCLGGPMAQHAANKLREMRLEREAAARQTGKMQK